MSDQLGSRTFGQNEEMSFFGRAAQDYSDDTARKIDEEITRLLTEAHNSARDILERHRHQTEQLVAQLLEHETVDGRIAEAIILGVAPMSEEPITPPSCP